MNNSFGHIPEDLLQQAQDAWEFKQCQRSDGTIYGSRGDCKQKGSKEVKSQQGNTPQARDLAANTLSTNHGTKENAKEFQKAINKMDDEALRNNISLIGSKLELIGFGRSYGDMDKQEAQYGKKALPVLKALFDRRREIAEGEGRKVPTATSVLSEKAIKKMGLTKDQMNVIAATGKAAKPKSTPAPKPKAKSKSRYSYEDNRKQYKVFYNMVRNQGLGHGDAAGAAEDAMRAKGFDPGDISNQYRKEVREAF